MREINYWIKVIEWLNKNEFPYLIHRTHKSQISSENSYWLENFEKKKGIIPTHSYKLKNHYPDFLMLENDQFHNFFYTYSLEVKGEINRSEFERGVIQCENFKSGVDYSVLLIPQNSIKLDYEKELNKKHILLGIIQDDDVVINKAKNVYSNFDPIFRQKILRRLFLLQQKIQNEYLSRIRTGKTIFLHYLIPGFVKYLYKKYENTQLTSNSLLNILKTHWYQLIEEGDMNNINKIESSVKIEFKEWDSNNLNQFITISTQFGFMDNVPYFFSLIETYLSSLAPIDIPSLFKTIENIEIRKLISKFYNCAIDMKGRNIWLFQKHSVLSNIILDFLSNRKDMLYLNQILNIMEKNRSHNNKKIGLSIRDLIDYISKDDFSLAKELFFKKKQGLRKFDKDICLNRIGKLECPFGKNLECYPEEIKNLSDLERFYRDLFRNINDPNNFIDDYDSIPEIYHENNDKSRPLRFGFIKGLIDSRFYYNFKRNLIHLGYFPNEFIKLYYKHYKNYPIGNDTRFGRYCPYYDRWSIDIENDAIKI